MRHYLTYQHNVQRYFKEHSDKYDGVIIPLSIVTAFPSGTYGFIRALCSAHPDKQYAIDPRNALFQKKWNRDNVRPPHEKMAAALGEPYVGKALAQPLCVSDVSDDDVLDAHVKHTVEMQLQFSSRSEDARKLEKYKKLLGISSLGALGVPQFIIPPYYQFSNNADQWFTVNQRCVAAALKYNKDVPVRPVFHFQEWAAVDWGACHTWLASLETEEFWYYPNFFKEHEAPSEELKAYRKTVEAASENGLKPAVLFGGYYAILMSKYGLQGFGNGIGYGEWRDSGYHRGGTAATRIYLLKLHRYIDAAAAQYLVEQDPEYFGSDTDIVAGYIESGVSLVEMALNEALDHFMECRRQEIDFVESHPLPAIVAELDETMSRLEGIGPLEQEKYGISLAKWKAAVE